MRIGLMGDEIGERGVWRVILLGVKFDKIKVQAWGKEGVGGYVGLNTKLFEV